jgi:dihydroorotate dehydrogenase (NAD+) catalytic subunit
MPDLSVTIAGKKLKNPILPASGTYESTGQTGLPGDPALLGALINKTVTRDERAGNPPPRVWETPAGLLNSVGIPSTGIRAFIDDTLPKLRAQTDRLIVSIAGFSGSEFVELAKLVEQTGQADYLELNLSCPNLDCEKIWSTDADLLRRVVTDVKNAVSLPVIAKLSPNVTDIGEMARVAEKAGADALSLVNTYRGLAIDIRARRPALGNISGGLSGPAIKPLALHAVWAAYEKVSVPIIGMGGVTGWQDAVEFIMAGATAVAVGMYTFVDPGSMWRIIESLRGYLTEKGLESIGELTGAAHGRR